MSYDGFQEKMKTLKISAEPRGDKKAAEETRREEQWVKHAPDIVGRQASVFDWDYRSLVIANIQCDTYPEEAKGLWCMYKCNKPRAGSALEKLDKNPFFKKNETAIAFGDVYIFRLKKDTPGNSGMMEYAESWKVPQKEVAHEIFVLLASLNCEK